MNFKNPSVDILKNKELYIFDMDGTVYLGGKPFDFAIKFIKNLKESGKRAAREFCFLQTMLLIPMSFI